MSSQLTFALFYAELPLTCVLWLQSLLSLSHIRILAGTNHKSTPPVPRLYQIVGKTCPRCIQMSSLSWSHFNSGNVMLLQTPNIIFVWVGRSSSSIERIHALGVASKFRDCQTEVVVVEDGYEQSMSAERKVEWNRFLSLSERLVHPLVVAPFANNAPLKLYKCHNGSGLLRVEHLKTDAIEQIDFADKNSTFIIDGESNGVWIWMGRSVTKADKADGLRYARGFMIKKNYPTRFPVSRVMDGHEPVDFVSLFPHWNDNEIARHVLEKFDALTLTQRPLLSAQMQLIDDGSGELKVYKIDRDDIHDIPRKFGHIFYTENSYIVHYQTMNGSIRNLIYLWMGKKCKQIDKTTGELFLSEMFEHFNTNVVQFRVHEGMEPPHFLQLFKGKLIVLKEIENGGRIPVNLILKVLGNSTYTAKAVQIAVNSSHSPTDCYIIKGSNSVVWVWCGHSSTGDSREIAKGIASVLGDSNLVMEGSESDEFYDSVGEKCLNQLRSLTNVPERSLCSVWDKSRVSLYLTTLTQGQIQLEPIFAYNQMDLCPENIYLLDAGSIIYVWLGELVDPEQREGCWVMAMHLISIHPIPRDISLPIAVIKQGFEPSTFVGFFDKWDPKLFNVRGGNLYFFSNLSSVLVIILTCFQAYLTFDKLRIQMNLPGTHHPIPPPRSIRGDELQAFGISSNEFDKHQKYPLEMLRGDPLNLPTYINPSRKEVSLQ